MFVPLQKIFLTIFDKSKKSFRPEEEIVFSVKTKTENLKKNYSQPLRNIHISNSRVYEQLSRAIMKLVQNPTQKSLKKS